MFKDQKQIGSVVDDSSDVIIKEANQKACIIHKVRSGVNLIYTTKFYTALGRTMCDVLDIFTASSGRSLFLFVALFYTCIAPLLFLMSQPSHKPYKVYPF